MENEVCANLSPRDRDASPAQEPGPFSQERTVCRSPRARRYRSGRSAETCSKRERATSEVCGRELLDTSRAMVWRFDAAGLLVGQKKRTGETDFTVAYTTATGDAITDPAGGRTQMTVNAQGDPSATPG